MSDDPKLDEPVAAMVDVARARGALSARDARAAASERITEAELLEAESWVKPPRMLGGYELIFEAHEIEKLRRLFAEVRRLRGLISRAVDMRDHLGSGPTPWPEMEREALAARIEGLTPGR